MRGPPLFFLEIDSVTYNLWTVQIKLPQNFILTDILRYYLCRLTLYFDLCLPIKQDGIWQSFLHFS